MNRAQILTGDCRTILPTLEPESVQTCVCSPPYWGLRDYGTAQWEGGDTECDHRVDRTNDRRMLNGRGELTNSCLSWTERDATPTSGNCPKCGARRIDSQLGLESTPEEYLANLVAVFREVWRVLRDDGTLWLNIGDRYASEKTENTNGIGGKSTLSYVRESGVATYKTVGLKVPKVDHGLKPKDLCMMPARLAMALQADGWYLRSEIVWHKPNPMPESVTDRPTKSHEMIYLLAKQERYYYDSEAIREPSVDSWNSASSTLAANGIKNVQLNQMGQRRTAGADTFHRDEERYGRNKRSVWTVATQPFSAAHFATFPEDLIKPCILAGSRLGDTVLDPFAGSGTTGKVAIELGRQAILIELKPDYIELAQERTFVTPGFL